MTGLVALLRGVNVGGVTIRSADLAEVFRALGFDGVRTVLASGNVVFEADATDRTAIKKRIEHALGERFGYDAWIVLVTREQLARAADAFPFDADDASRQPYLVFCSEDGIRDELAAAAASLTSPDDPVGTGPGVLYWSPPKGRTLDTAFAHVLAKPTYKSTTTTRNLRTVRKLLG